MEVRHWRWLWRSLRRTCWLPWVKASWYLCHERGEQSDWQIDGWVDSLSTHPSICHSLCTERERWTNQKIDRKKVTLTDEENRQTDGDRWTEGQREKDRLMAREADIERWSKRDRQRVKRSLTNSKIERETDEPTEGQRESDRWTGEDRWMNRQRETWPELKLSSYRKKARFSKTVTPGHFRCTPEHPLHCD